MTSGSCIENDEVELVLVEILQNLGERLRLVDTWDAAHDLVQEGLTLLLDLLIHALHGLPAITSSEDARETTLILSWINLEAIEVLETINQGGLPSELLVECIREVVGRVSRNNQHGLPVLGHLDGQTAGSGGLANAAFSADEYPLQ